MRVKIISASGKDYKPGFNAIVVHVATDGRVFGQGLHINISTEEMFGDNPSGFQMAGLDDLIKEKIVESGKWNIKKEDIEFLRGEMYVKG